MASTFFGLNIARSGMSTYNAWLNTTAHNIANVKTKGYTRQIVNQAATVPISYKTRFGMAGSGVEAISILSERDVYYDAKYRSSNTNYGRYAALNYYMETLQDYLYTKDSLSGGLTNAMDKFFTAVSTLTESPSNTTMRTETVGYAASLTSYIQEAASNLLSMQKDINEEIAHTVDLINAYGEEIAFLNKQINSLEVDGTRANDLRDKRAYLLDQLSELVDIQVVEREPEGESGLRQFVVSIGGALLVDTNTHNSIEYIVSGVKSSQNDYDKLYDLQWSNGQNFDIHGKGLGGKLQGLFEMRDGNNGEVFTGKATATAGSNVITITDVNDLGRSILKLNLPATDGVITIGTSKYQYESFEVKVDANGNYTYEFTLKAGTTVGTAINGQQAKIGDEVEFRGIPYYMSQLNEFIRTFSYKFNEIQTQGIDLNGNRGRQMFIGRNDLLTADLNFEDFTELDANGVYTFNSLIGSNPSYNANGKLITSYYQLTALNTIVDPEMRKDGSLLACADDVDGVENGNNLKIMSALEYDKTMFRQGQPAAFLQVLTTTVGVDGQMVKTAEANAENIKDSVDNRRLSKAGVDEDEEGQNLIICQNLLNYQYKVLSVMNEVLDKLINGTAV